MERHFKIRGRIGTKDSATVTIKPIAGEDFLFTVKPARDRRSYALSLAHVAEMVVYKVVKLEGR